MDAILTAFAGSVSLAIGLMFAFASLVAASDAWRWRDRGMVLIALVFGVGSLLLLFLGATAILFAIATPETVTA